MTVKPDELITPEYRRMQEVLHAAPEGYGGKGSKWVNTVAGLVHATSSTSVLDYGCGRGSLGRALREIYPKLSVFEYDPAIPEKRELPKPADLVVCTDVLEHVEGPQVPAVLLHLRSLTQRAAFVVISLVPSAKILTDGRGAHVTLESTTWWQDMIRGSGFGFASYPCPKPEKQLAGILSPR